MNDLWAYDPNRCDGDWCPMNCQWCRKNPDHDTECNDHEEEDEDERY